MREVLPNIPFYWTAAAHWLPCAVMYAVFAGRQERKRRLFISALFLPVFLVYMYFTEPQQGALFNALMAGFAALTALHLHALSGMGLRRTLYFGTRLFLYSGMMSSLSWQVFIYLRGSGGLFGLTQREHADIPWMILSYAALTGLLVLIEYRGFSENRELSISWPMAVSTAATGVVVYILSSLSFARVDTPFSGQTYADAFNIRTLVYLAGTALLYAANIQLREARTGAERDALKNMLDMQYRSFQLERESVELVNRRYHDLKHQIAVLRTGIGEGQKLEYLDRLEKEIAVYEARNRTGNEVLDTILAGRTIHCQENGIQLTCVADGSLLSFMDLVDVSVLFGNALDNAIEACEQVEEGERLIHLSVSRHQGFIRIRVENRYSGERRQEGGRFFTTRPDPSGHGYGMKSIEQVSARNGGSVTAKAENGWFELRVLLPVPEGGNAAHTGDKTA